LIPILDTQTFKKSIALQTYFFFFPLFL
jgi:hypothetical protein